ncbi:WD40 repeat domain-containing protein [Calothrix sp. PCC 6303]|uniref:WD40 repeat domain-containing protein n=1 Tax=Calothrix sp. PCC 6303 TaxID=1170562 RepID=UPI0002A02665|nr:WD40 repeat domain-containing protein [Calothrix sp. PCC 6303]AFZ02809.1 WD40 repeat-containing protein [Calothrix sp. PCC 6303]
MQSSTLLKSLAVGVFSFSACFSITQLSTIADTSKQIKIITKAKLTLSGHTAPVRALALSPNQEILASGDDNKIIKLWDVKTGKKLFDLTGHVEAIKYLAFTPDGTIVASCDNQTIKFWDSRTGKIIRNLVVPKSNISSFVITPDGSRLMSSSEDKIIRFWDIKTGKVPLILKAEARVLAISLDGKKLFSGGEAKGKVRVWDIATVKQLQTFLPPVNKQSSLPASASLSLAVTPDGETLMSGGYNDDFQSTPLQQTDGKNLKAWNLKTSKLNYNTSVNSPGVDSLVISPDGKTFFASGLNQQAMIYDIKTAKPLISLQGHAGGIYAFVFTRDRTTVYSGSGDKSIKVWQLPK